MRDLVSTRTRLCQEKPKFTWRYHWTFTRHKQVIRGTRSVSHNTMDCEPEQERDIGYDYNSQGGRKGQGKTAIVPVAFDLLPLELCHKIFAEACIDGGRTGRALSAVSRGVALASRRYKYYSLVVRGVYEAEGLAESLERIVSHAHFHPVFANANYDWEARYNAHVQEAYPRAVHLYIECDSHQIYNDAIALGDFSPSLFLCPPRPIYQSIPIGGKGIHTARAHQIKWVSALGTWARDGRALRISIEALWTRAVSRILRIVGRTLASLTLAVLAPKHPVTLPLPVSLPVLRELDLVYTRDTFHRSATRLLDSFPPIASLRRLGLGQYDCRCLPGDLLRQVARVAPRVEEVRLMRTGVRDGWVLYLGRGVRADEYGSAGGAAVGLDSAIGHPYALNPLPPNVKKIIIPPPTPPLSPLHAQYSISEREYSMLAARDARIVLVRADKDSDLGQDVDGGMLEREWIGRLRGENS